MTDWPECCNRPLSYSPDTCFFHCAKCGKKTLPNMSDEFLEEIKERLTAGGTTSGYVAERCGCGIKLAARFLVALGARQTQGIYKFPSRERLEKSIKKLSTNIKTKKGR